jgi:hypothetical protein
MQQQALFFECIEDALAVAIDALGGRKKVACEMWPDLPASQAHNMINACLNAERREKFSPSQVVWLAARAGQVGCHAVMQYMAREGGYAEPQPLEPEDELQALLREHNKLLEQSAAAAKRLEQVMARASSVPRAHRTPR